MADDPQEETLRSLLLVREAVTKGRVPLPTLTREELGALGSLEGAPWAESRELAWWTGLSDGVRTAVSAAAVAGLGARGLVDLDAAPPVERGARTSLPATTELRVLLATRDRPTVLIVAGDAAAERPGLIRLSAALVEEGGTACWLLEVAEEDGLHRFALCSADEALSRLAAWMCLPAEVDPESGDPAPLVRTLDVLQPEGTIRYVVFGGTRGVALAEADERGQIGDSAVAITAGELRARLDAVLGGAAGATQGA
jgi:hypothetical protein